MKLRGMLMKVLVALLLLALFAVARNPAAAKQATHVLSLDGQPCITVVERRDGPDGDQIQYWVKFYNGCAKSVRVEIVQLGTGAISPAWVPGDGGEDTVRCWYDPKKQMGCRGFSSDWNDYP